MFAEVVVVGAGFSGAVCARRLAESGKNVCVIERLNHIAGHSYDYKNEYGITVHKYGPHIFHTNEKSVWDFIKPFSDFHHYQHRVLSYAEGNLYEFPINLDTINQVFGTHLNINEVEDFLKTEIKKYPVDPTDENFETAVISQVGEHLYNLFFRNYTLKQWEKEPKELSSQLAKRIPIRKNRDNRYFSDKYQGIPERGYTHLIKNILNHPNISVLTNTDYFSVSDSLSPSLTIYTGELDRYFDYKYGKLEYRSLELEFKNYDRAFYQNVATVNYPNDYDWTRITEFKHFLNESSEQTTVCFEYPKADGEPYYVVMNDENLKKREKYIKEVERLEKTGKVFFVGRLAEYKYYNMDQVILRSLQKTEEWLNHLTNKM
ncbi:MAG TPA: UDP-galactopyranose mutase [Thermotogota bacterium]|nr:UDP-galactopyranose mutase [Thermotogota bacterium]HPR94838.1 UDP-galactopyranose mutase [Thermotogota bacterium]